MRTDSSAKLATIYVNSTDQWHGRPLYSAIVQQCKDHGIAGATALRCDEGYGAHGRLHTHRLLELSENLPVRIEIVDQADKIEALLNTLDPMLGEGLITITDVQIRRYLTPPG